MASVERRAVVIFDYSADDVLKRIALVSMAVELQLIIRVLDVDLILGRRDPGLWALFEARWREVEFWKLVLG